MTIDISVACDCWERGLCKPCPINPLLLSPIGAHRDWQAVLPGIDNYETVSKEFQSWKDTACDHLYGKAYIFTLGPPDVVSRIATDINSVDANATVLVRTLNYIAFTLYCISGVDDAKWFLKEAAEILATGKLLDTQPLGEVSTYAAVIGIAKGSETSIKYNKPIIWY
jgi:hypothetical protein